ncbi:hypothetical protein NQ318_016315 [Aromia moschata]|uniref:Uncharacterized protein n=1 Tax=Aromia moschata TaxID=1265417 RepID=A0AAV8Z5S7_9CUCU|nr:hypothetical protein NQ318_016315 [Aromia moschata]
MAKNKMATIPILKSYNLVIDVSENLVTEIQKLAFKDIYLSHINLSKNNISKVEAGSFENCANITKLDLSFNQITGLPKKSFR